MSTSWVIFNRLTRKRVSVTEHEASTTPEAKRVAARKLGCPVEELDTELTTIIRAETQEERDHLAATAAKDEVVWSFRGKQWR